MLAENNDAKAKAIAQQQDESDAGFESSAAEVKMVIRDASGREATRDMKLFTLEKPEETGGDHTIILFENPADVSGTALLSHANILEPDHQWLYLPSLSRVRRISGDNRSGPFMSSEFAYEDITAEELDKYEYRYLKSETCGELTCDVIERTPRYPKSGYSRQVVYIDQSHHQIRQVDYFDRNDRHVKTQYMDQYTQYDNKYWRPHRQRMVNHVTDRETDLLFSGYRFGVALSSAHFQPGALTKLQ